LSNGFFLFFKIFQLKPESTVNTRFGVIFTENKILFFIILLLLIYTVSVLPCINSTPFVTYTVCNDARFVSSAAGELWCADGFYIIKNSVAAFIPNSTVIKEYKINSDNIITVKMFLAQIIGGTFIGTPYFID